MDFGPNIWTPPTPPTAVTPSPTPAYPPEGGPPEPNASFLCMLFLTFVSMALTGSTLEWVISRGVFSKGLRNPLNTYNIIVLLAGTFSGIQAICNFLLYFYEPTQVWFLFLCLLQWMITTHTSVMVVSNRVSMLYRDPRRVWKRLLLINVFMLPVSILVFVSWGGDKLSGSLTYKHMNRIIEPMQIALWGIIEFVLSGIFIKKMWAFNWTAMERKAILVLIFVGLCDLSTVLANILIRDLPSTVVKAFAYCLRIRLEISVLSVLVDYLKAKSTSRVSAFSNIPDICLSGNTCRLTSSLRGPYSAPIRDRFVRFTDDDEDSSILHTVELGEDGTAKATPIKITDEIPMDLERSSSNDEVLMDLEISSSKEHTTSDSEETSSRDETQTDPANEVRVS